MSRVLGSLAHIKAPTRDHVLADEQSPACSPRPKKLVERGSDAQDRMDQQSIVLMTIFSLRKGKRRPHRSRLQDLQGYALTRRFSGS